MSKAAKATKAGNQLRGVTEAIASVRGAGVDLALVGGAGAAGLAGVFAGTVAAIDALHGGTPPRRTGLPLWLAAGTVAALAGGAAFTLLKAARGDLRELGAAPRKAIQEAGHTAGAVAGGLRRGSSDG